MSADSKADKVDTISLTYADAAVRMGIAVASVRRIATRLRWDRVRGNDGKWRVMVPADRLSCRPTSNDLSADNIELSADERSDIRALIRYLEASANDLKARIMRAEDEAAELRPLASRVAVLEAERDAARAMVEAEKRRTADLVAKVEKIVEAERQRADDLKAALNNAMEPRGWFSRWRRAG